MLGVAQIQLNSPFGYDENLAKEFASSTASCSKTQYTITSLPTYTYAISPVTTELADEYVLSLAVPPVTDDDEPALSPIKVTYNSTSHCALWHTVKEHDRCDTISWQYYISLTDLHFLNPQLNDECDNLWLGSAYCVRVVKDIEIYAGHTDLSLWYTFLYGGYYDYPLEWTLCLPIDKLEPGTVLDCNCFTKIVGCDIGGKLSQNHYVDSYFLYQPGYEILAN